MKNIIRPAEAKDIDFIIEANAKISEASDPDNVAVGLRERVLSDILSDNPKAFVLIMEADGAQIGMALYAFAYFANEGRIMWLSQIYVREENRKFGAAMRLMNALKKEAARTGCYAICGGVGDENIRAKKVYKFTGAKELDNYKLFYAEVD